MAIPKKDRSKCPDCKKLLYRSKEKGTKVKKDDPYIHCRNLDCKKRRKKQRKKVPKKRRSESDAVKAAREYAIEKLGSQKSLMPYVVATAVILQELTIHDAANILIERFGLEAEHGLKKVV